IGGNAAADGTFSLSLPLDTGTNPIRLPVTDPAVNQKPTPLPVRRGSGRLTASVSLSFYSISQRQLPQQIRLVANVDDPDGGQLAGGRGTFAFRVPGLRAR